MLRDGHRRDFIYVDDLIQVVIKAIDGVGCAASITSLPLDYAIEELFDLTLKALQMRLDEPVEVRPRGPDDVFYDPSRPSKDEPRLRLEDHDPAGERDRARIATTSGSASPRPIRTSSPLRRDGSLGSAERMDLKGRRLLLIGGGGLIGSHTADALLRRTWRRSASTTTSAAAARRTSPRLSRTRALRIFEDGGDILHRDVLDRAMRGIDGVFHFAALWLLHCHELPPLRLRGERRRHLHTSPRRAWATVCAAPRLLVVGLRYGDAVQSR
jgi:hypothetical protein